MNKKNVTRRSFLAGAAALAAGCATGNKDVATKPIPKIPSANGKINVAAVGAGGKGYSDITGCKSENVVALCDVDWKQAARAFHEFPNAKQYKDYRVMFDEMANEIDAVTVSTPDHMHAPVAMAAMECGLHVYVQKPLAHTVNEARIMTEAARKYKVKTQMGNQGRSGDGVREMAEIIWSGDIGSVKEAHIWTNRPIWPQGLDRPAGSDPVPEKLDWDLWLGAAPERPYIKTSPADPNRPCYCPFVWRGWWDFGCGALGDMACHIMDPANYSLFLGKPTSFELVMQEGRTSEQAPNASTIKYEFPAREGVLPDGRTMQFDPVTVYWYDGSLANGSGQNLPPRPEGVAADVELGEGDNGSYFVGTKGIATTGTYGDGTRIIAGDAATPDYKKPDPWIPRVKGGHYEEWLRAVRGEQDEADSWFDYSGPFTETVLLGNFCVRIGEPGQKFEYDAAKGEITNVPEANRFLTKDYRAGFEV